MFGAKKKKKEVPNQVCYFVFLSFSVYKLMREVAVSEQGESNADIDVSVVKKGHAHLGACGSLDLSGSCSKCIRNPLRLSNKESV